jgi:hypothetical protein
MVRKRQRNSGVVKYVCCAVFVLLVVLWVFVSDGFLAGTTIGWVVVIVAAAAPLALILWALIEQFRFSFGKSRFLTRTQRKRLLHQRKNKVDEKIILGRKIPEQHDR